MSDAVDRSRRLPDEFGAMLRGFQESRVALTAIELDVFTHLGEAGATAATVAEKAGTHPAATARLLNVLVSMGLVTKDGETYRNGELADTFLRDGAPHDQRAATMHTANLFGRWATLTACVREGTSVTHRDEGVKAWNPDRAESFIAAMHRGAILRAPAIVEALCSGPIARSLDLGGGSGAYTIALAEAHPELQATLMDLPEVTPITRRYVADSPAAARIAVVDGDMRTDAYPDGNDIIFLSSVLHMFGPDENRGVIQRVADALKPGGRVAIQEFVMSDDKTGPLPAALFSINMLVGTEAGDAYSLAEMREWLTAAGFGEVAHHRLPQSPTSLIVATKK